MIKKSAVAIFLIFSFLCFATPYANKDANVFVLLNEFSGITKNKNEINKNLALIKEKAEKVSGSLENIKSDSALKKLCKNDRMLRTTAARIRNKTDEILEIFNTNLINDDEKLLRLKTLISNLESDIQIFETYNSLYVKEVENLSARKTKIIFIVLICLAILALSSVVCVFILNRRLKRKSEVSKKITSLLENERKRISRDLHDGVIQDLRSIKLESDRISSQTISDISDKTIKELRSVCYSLSPPDLHLESGASIETLLLSLCREFQKKKKIACSFFADENLPKIKSKDEMLAVYRIVQEALQNISVHSDAQSCSVVVKKVQKKKSGRKRNTESIAIFITDDGNGFDVDESLKKPFHFGLKSMFERAEQIGAALKIESAAGDGTEIKLELKK